MQQIFRDGAARAVGPLARTLTGARARVLMYHRFGEPGAFRRTDTESFDRQVRYIKKNFRPRRLREVVARLQAREPLEERTVVITVDDGYGDFARFAYPILARHRIPATVYIVSQFASQRLWLWFDALDYIARCASSGQHSVYLGARLSPVMLRSDEQRYELWTQLAAHCVDLPTAERERTILQLQQQLGVILPVKPTDQYAAMTWDEIRSLDADLVEIGAHTCTHPILSQCSLERQRAEIEDCKRTIEAELRRPIDAFCYPNGMPQDFTAATADIVRACGFSSAVMACGGTLDPGADPFRLPRLGAPTEWDWFRNCINGLWELRASQGRRQPLGY